MKQISLSQAHETFSIRPKRTRKQRFLDEMNAVVPWQMIEQLIAPHYSQPSAKGGRPPARLSAMLRIFFLQQWFGLSDPAVEEALHDMPTYRHFVGLDAGIDTMPDETTILRFRHLLEEHKLQQRIFDLVRHLLQA